MLNLTDHLLHLFYPHPGNNHQAKLRQHSGLLGLIFLIITVQIWIQVITLTYPQVLGYASNITVNDILQLTNQKRTGHGLHSLQLNSSLSQAAQKKAEDMFDKNYWAHLTPTGQPPWSFISNSGYTYLYAGENLARDFNDATSVIAAWMASPSHRDNLLNNRYDDIGIAVVNGELSGTQTTLIVQMFGAKRIATKPSQITRQALAVSPTKTLPSLTQTPIPLPTVTITNTLSTTTSPPITSFSASTRDRPPHSTPAISLFTLQKSLGVAVVILLSGVLLIDEIIIRRQHLTRITGRSWAHFAFLLTTLGILLLTKQGIII